MEMNKVEDYETFRKTVSGEVLDIGLTKEMVNPFYLVDEKRASYLKIADAFEEVYRDDIYTLDSRQRRAYRGLYSFKDRMVIIFMRMTFLYRIYRWALVHIPLPFIKKRRMWLESYQDKEFRKWKEMNVIEADTDGEVDAVIHRIQGLVEG